VGRRQFLEILENCRSLKVRVRPEPALSSDQEGIGQAEQSGHSYQHFYFSDPTGLNIEIMTSSR
jgi:hypothetical protein